MDTPLKSRKARVVAAAVAMTLTVVATPVDAAKGPKLKPNTGYPGTLVKIGKTIDRIPGNAPPGPYEFHGLTFTVLAPPPEPAWPPQPGVSWQIQFPGELDFNQDAQVYDIDMQETHGGDRRPPARSQREGRLLRQRRRVGVVAAG